MIKNNEPLSMSEASEYVKQTLEKDTEVSSFIKKFVKLNAKESRELKDKLEKLDLIKLKSEHLVKIIDLMPENKEDLNKIFAGISLDEDETKKILDAVKEFK